MDKNSNHNFIVASVVGSIVEIYWLMTFARLNNILALRQKSEFVEVNEMANFKEKDYKIFEMFDKDWALVTAGNESEYNSCTVSWGSLGNIWAHAGTGGFIATMYIHPARYTSELLKKYDTFTVSFYDKDYKGALGYMGSHSGREENKALGAKLTPVVLGEGVTYEEAKLTFLCHKLYMHQFSKDDLADEIKAYYAGQPKIYPNVTPDGTEDDWEAHYMIVGKIIEAKESIK